MPSLRSRAGYIEIDHRDGPGVTAADLARVGAPARFEPAGPGTVTKADVKYCAHCARAVLLNPERERPRGYCGKCDAYVCDRIECRVECRPIAKLMDTLQNLAVKGQRATPAAIDHHPLLVFTDDFKESKTCV